MTDKQNPHCPVDLSPFKDATQLPFRRQEVTEADLYALRAFLCASLEDTPAYRKACNPPLIFDAKGYLIPHVTRCYKREGIQFSLRKLNHLFSAYDVLNFRYASGKIKVEKVELRTEQDKEEARGIGALLKQKPYGQLVSNLDELLME